MLDHEYKLLLDRLNPARGNDTRFFVFADTVATRNYQGNNEQHGWLGICFQTDPVSNRTRSSCTSTFAIRLLNLQQQAIGILGFSWSFDRNRHSVEPNLRSG